MDMESDNDNVTCRICRGEGTVEEPLYHPCKCNGSIKYVHQDCLFEWLKHTKGKASCELCHTPYKLTKLYAKDMPKTIPIKVFLSKLISDIGQQSVKIFRLFVAIAVYVVALPYLTNRGVQVHTAFAELFPYRINMFLDFSKFINHIFSSRNPSSGVALTIPLDLDAFIGNKGFKNFLLDVFQGQELMIFLTLLICIVMFVREWILQNDPFVLHFAQDNMDDLRAENDVPERPQEPDVEIPAQDRVVEATLRNIIEGEREAENGLDRLNEEDLERLIRALGPAPGNQDRNDARRAMENDGQNRQEDENAGDEGAPIEDMDGLLDFLAWHRPILSLISIGTIVDCALFVMTFAIYMIPYAFGRVLLAFLGWTLIPFIWRVINIVIYGTGFAGFYSLLYLMKGLDLLSISHDMFSQEILLTNILVCRGGLSYVVKDGYTAWRIPDSGFSIRLGATTISYVIFGCLLSLYVKSNIRLTKTRAGRAAESMILNTIVQLGAILKVICIIGIELVVFPIFCGTLLHFSLVPLSDNDSLMDRIQFTTQMPIASTLVHWNMGTGYMFIFALFVSLCRRIMRPGVLYFVRDPNDANFHPLKEVLDRPLLFQLEKIAISGIVYSILIIGCIGGVLSFFRYGIDVAFLPLKSSTDLSWNVLRDIGILSIPIIFSIPRWYNMVSSLSLLRILWTFWFEICCSFLRLSSFILDKPYVNEQGYIYRGSWSSFFKFEKPDYSLLMTKDDITTDCQGTYFIRDGNYVRAPDTDTLASDRHLRLFVPVNKDDDRLDGLEEGSDNELRHYDIVYRPPNFPLRIAMLLVFIWLFGTAIVTSTCLMLLYSGIAVSKVVFGEEITSKLTSWILIGIGIPLTSIILFLLDRWPSLGSDLMEKWTLLRQRTHENNDLPSRHPSLMKFGVLCISAITFPHLIGNTLLNYFSLTSTTTTSILNQHSFIHCWLIGLTMLWIFKQSMIYIFSQSHWSIQYRNMTEQGWLRYDWNIFISQCANPILKVLLPVRILVEIIPYGFNLYQEKVNDATLSLNELNKISYSCYSCIYLTMMLLASFRMNRRLFDKFINSVRDDAYLIGRRLENHGNVR